MRPPLTPAPQANGGRMITDTGYDGRGLAVKVSTFWDANSPPGTALAGFADTNVANQHRASYDALERQTADQLWSLGALKWQTTTGYDGDRVSTTPPAGGTATTVIS